MPKKNPKHKSHLTSSDKIKGIQNLGKGKKVSQSLKCSVKGCNSDAIHSLSLTEWDKAISASGLDIEMRKKNRKFKICKEHYKLLKSIKKKEEKSLKKPIIDSSRQFKPSKLQGY
ncbi:MAG: hypothetical protein ACTSRZ_03485 [Promethearchaeota archaeon]